MGGFSLRCGNDILDELKNLDFTRVLKLGFCFEINFEKAGFGIAGRG